jgi:hypothetical protein
MKLKVIRERGKDFERLVTHALNKGWEIQGNLVVDELGTYVIVVIKPDRPGEARL